MKINKVTKTNQIIQSFLQIKMLKIFLLGVVSGFPWVLIGSSLSLWLKEDGLSRSSIGWAGLIFAVYAVNYLWAPVVDRLKIPYLTEITGHRKSWIILMQFFIILCLLIWFLLKPSENFSLIIFIGLIIAICSATQDIIIDALRIEQINSNNSSMMAAGASLAVMGWWSGYKLGGLIILSTAQYLENLGYENYWQITFIITISIVFLFNIGLFTIKEDSFQNKELNFKKLDRKLLDKFSRNNHLTKFISWFLTTILSPVTSFFRQNGLKVAILFLSFILLYKIGEAFLGRMSIIFYKEIGFSKSDIGVYSKGLGWITTIIFTFIGGLLTIKAGIYKSLFYAGIFMAASNLIFALLAFSGKSYLIFSIAIILDDITSAFATVAFVSFISMIIDRNYTATQYALLASIGTIGRTLLASSSGNLVDMLHGNWTLFFLITSIMVIPSLIILFFLKNKLNSYT